MEKVKRIFKLIRKILYVFMIVFVIILFVFGIVQRTSDNRKSIFGIKIFTVITGSMIPVYDIGAILIVKEVTPEEIKVHDDIVYEGKKGSYKNKTITHRVEKIDKKEDGNYEIITKGVNNSARDPEINQTQILGKVIGQISIFSIILKLITNIYVIILFPIVLLIYKNIKKIINMDVDTEKE